MADLTDFIDYSAGDVPSGVPDERTYQALPYGYGPDGKLGRASDPYGSWRGGRYIPAGTVYQTTPAWKQPNGPFTIGPFSGDMGWRGSPYEPPYADYAYSQLDMPAFPALLGPDPSGPDRGDTPELLESYSAQYGAVSAPVTPTTPVSLHEASHPLGPSSDAPAPARTRGGALSALSSLFRTARR